MSRGLLASMQSCTHTWNRKTCQFFLLKLMLWSPNYCLCALNCSKTPRSLLHNSNEHFLGVFSQANARNIDGSTPLCFACSKGSIQCVQLLIEAGAEVNPTLTVTFPPLHEAALNGHLHCVEMLLQLGADLEKSENQFGTALHVACIRGYAECVQSLLHFGANPNAIKRHQAPLHTAALCGYEECASILVQYGANVYQRNSQSKRPSDLATDAACRKMLLTAAGK